MSGRYTGSIRGRLILAFIAVIIIPMLIAIAYGSVAFYKIHIIYDLTQLEDRHDIQQVVRNQVSNSFVVGFTSQIIMIVIVTRYLLKSILRPLAELDDATRRVTAGDFNFTMSIPANKEFRQLITAFDKMRQELLLSMNKQKEQERLRKQLIAAISHDIRTPVSSIRGYVEGIQDGIIRDEQQRTRYLNVIHDKTIQLERLVDDLYQYSQLENNQLHVELQEHAANYLFHRLLEAWQLGEHSEQMLINIDIPVEWVIMADEQRLAQVFENVINNALSHTVDENRQIELDITSQAQKILVKIKDNGKGIAAEDLQHVFEPLYRGEKSRSRMHGGSGMGLYISRYIVEAHGGEISIDSTIDQGTTVTISLDSKAIL